MTSELVLSFDFELGWGVLESERWRERENAGVYTALRPVMSELVSVLTQLGISTTWAVVAAMLVESETDLQVDHLPDNYKRDLVDFVGNAHRETKWGADIVDQLLGMGSLTELASHSLTHFYPWHSDAGKEVCTTDMSLAKIALEKYSGRSISSVIFPRDQANWRSEMAALSPGNYRLNPKELLVEKYFWSDWRNTVRGFAGWVPQMDVFVGSYGECYQTGSMFFNAPPGRLHLLREIRLGRQVCWLLDSLKNTDGLFHIWLHPFNLAATPGLFVRFKHFLYALAKLQDSGQLKVSTMQSVGDRCRVG